MIKDVFASIGTAARKMVANWGALLISFALYAALIAALYFFFTTREASIFQVALSLVVLPVAAIFLFFVFQMMGLSYVRIGVGPAYLLKRALKDFWKLLVITVPLILVSWLIFYLIGKVEGYLISQVDPGTGEPARWKMTAVDWARMVWIYFALPLMAIHLWITAAREGVRGAFRGAGRSLARAFAPGSVLTYTVVAAIFGAIAYFLFFTRTPAKSEWTELWVFAVRVIAALISIFFGWLLALGSLAELTARGALKDIES